MAELVNAQTNMPEEISQDAVQDNLTSGKYNLKAGAPVNVLDPDGNLVSLPAEQIPDALQNDYSIPKQSDITEYQNQQQYGEGVLNPLEAAGAGAARAATLGATGYINSKAQAELAKRNPIATGVGEAAGIVGSLLAAPEESIPGLLAKASKATEETVTPIAQKIAGSIVNPETSPIVSKILKSAANVSSKALGSALETSVYGLGQSVTENALGDTDFNAENILHNMGYAALFGGTIGGAFGLAGETYGGLKNFLSPEAEQAALKHTIIDDAAGIGTPTINPPTSLEEMQSRTAAAEKMGYETDLPQAKRIQETNEILAGDSKFPATQLQVDSLDPAKRVEYRVLAESDTPEGKIIRDYNSAQKYEATNILTPKYIQEIAPEATLADTSVDAGEKIVKDFKDATDKISQGDAELYDQIDKIGLNEVADKKGLLDSIYTAVPGAKDYVQQLENGTYITRPYRIGLGVEKGTYNILKDMTRELNGESLTVQNIRNMRKIIRDNTDFSYGANKGLAKEMSSLNKNLLDYLQNEINKAVPDINVREAFKRTAINEKNKATMQEIFGGSMKEGAEYGDKIEHANVLKRMFSDRETAMESKRILGDAAFNEALANHVNQTVKGAVDTTRGLNPTKVLRVLNNPSRVMDESFAQYPDQLTKLRATMDKLKSLPENTPANPSNTAKAMDVMQKMVKLTNLLRHPTEIPGKMFEGVLGKIDSARRHTALNAQLAGEAAAKTEQTQRMYGAYIKIERMAQATTNAIARGVKTIMSGVPAAAVAVQKGTPGDSRKKYEKTEKKLRDLSLNPDKFINSLENSTRELHAVAPATTNSLHLASSRAVQYLSSKLPVEQQSAPFSEPHKPSDSEIAKFNRYSSIVENPLSILKQVQQGTLTKESMEAIATVYPKLYQQMQNEVMDHLTQKNAVSLPYSTKLMLSLFTGQDLSNSLTQQNISSAQQAHSTPGMQAKPPGARQHQAISKITASNQSLTDLQKTERS